MPTKTFFYHYKCVKCGFANQTTVTEENAVEPHKVNPRFSHGATVRYWNTIQNRWVEGDFCDGCLDSGVECIDG